MRMAIAQRFKVYSLKIGSVLGCIIQCGCITHCFMEYVADFVVCSGPSMEPTLFSNNILVSEHLSPRLRKIQRGDIVIAKSLNNPKQHICKRVTGVEGDKIKIGFVQHIVPRGYIWLEGDNQNNSSDSRNYGPVPVGLVRGRAVCRVWPFQEAKMLTDRGKWSVVR